MRERERKKKEFKNEQRSHINVTGVQSRDRWG